MNKAWQQNLALSSLKLVFVDLIGDFLYWPIWWFTVGAAKWALFCFNKIKEAENYLGVRIWLANLFTPMFAQYDWQGRLISFFMRLFMIIVKTIILIAWSIIVFILLLAWFILPLFVVYFIWFNLNHLMIFK